MPPPEPHTAPVAVVPKKMSKARASECAFSLMYAEFKLGGSYVVTKFVPPTAVTCGLAAGMPTPTCIAPQGVGGEALKHAGGGTPLPPPSPEAATKVMPCRLPSAKKSS